MKSRRKKSRKRSGASSTAARKRLERTVFYLDESIYSRILVRLIRDEGATARHAGDAFPFGTADEIWLKTAGENGWIVLTRDQRIRFRLLERLALQRARVGAFVFTGGEASAEQTATVLRGLLRKMANIAMSEPRPFLYTFGLGGILSRMKVHRRRRLQ